MSKKTISAVSILTLSPIFLTLADGNIDLKKLQQLAKTKNFNLPLTCKKTSPIVDIWKLEPMLIKNGQITPKMTQEHKKIILQKYVKDKNAAYNQCIKGTKSTLNKKPA